jgi:acetylornithine/succinyldiaminopimelate/putrescine aminotransferase
VRFAPPLIIEKAEIDLAITRVGEVLAEIDGKEGRRAG